jgi:tetratricopeptide (TPR) repeat protein
MLRSPTSSIRHEHAGFKTASLMSRGPFTAHPIPRLVLSHGVTRRHVGAVAGFTAATTGMMIAAGGLVVAAAASAASSSGGGKGPRELLAQGSKAFRDNRVEESIECFDSVLKISPSSRPFLWQRGLSLYYVGQYQEAAKQFRDDVAVNPNDTEEAIWAFLSECRVPSIGPEKARESFLKVGRDSRTVMRAALEAFEAPPGPNSTSSILAVASPSSPHDQFYSKLYCALFCEAYGREEEAKEFMKQAVRTEYAVGSGDYMADLARVHVKRRGWDVA